MSLIDNPEQQIAELAILQATEAELTEGTDAALRALGPPTDPSRTRAALAILIRAKRHSQAGELIRDRIPDNKWLDLASFVFAFLGDLDRAKQFVARGDESSDTTVMWRTRLGFAEGILDRWATRCDGKPLLTVSGWQEDDILTARTVIDILDPLISSVQATRSIKSDLELTAVERAILCARVANDHELLRTLSAWLIQHVPVPLFSGELCLRGLIDCPTNLVSRLQIEHPGDFQASLIAALVLRDLLRSPQEAFELLVKLAEQPAAAAETESLCGALFETCGLCSLEHIDRAIAIVHDLLPHSDRLLRLMESFKLLKQDRAEEAYAQVSQLRDEEDPTWWQAYAQCCHAIGQDDDAQEAWERASDLLPHPEIARRSIQASLDRRRFESAVRVAKKLLEQAPGSEQELRSIALALVHLGDHAQAIDYLFRLVRIAPSVLEYRTELARCLARTARTAEAVEVLKPLCDAEEAPIDVVLMQSEFLGALGRHEDAISLLDSIAADYWDTPRFLVTYLKHAHAAGDDKAGHEAFVRLIELRQEGKVHPELLQEKTLEQLLEYGKEYNQRREALQDAVVRGRMPWLLAEDLLGNPPLWAWTLHTQKLRWLSEERLNRAAYSIYSTNSFTVRSTGENADLKKIEPEAPFDRPVVDVSALVTLHHLGRLVQAAEVFGPLVLPASYGDIHVRDAGR